MGGIIISNQKRVVLYFVNNKGLKKCVKFYIDKKSYDLLFDKSIAIEERQKYLIDEYHEYERERYYKRKHISLDSIDNLVFSPESSVFYEIDYAELKEAINKLSPMQKEIIKRVYFEGKKQHKVAKELNVSKGTVSITLKRALVNLKKSLQKKA